MSQPKTPWEQSQTREYLAAHLCESFTFYNRARYHGLSEEEKDVFRKQADDTLYEMINSGGEHRRVLARRLLMEAGMFLSFEDEGSER